ncbi:hypothetical protein [Kiloniella litopenaei]|uniref:hypothetical protein n=1 Tax=Kiloniella litopenaei TaxID=1549748 RepID=UPI003BAD3038
MFFAEWIIFRQDFCCGVLQLAALFAQAFSNLISAFDFFRTRAHWGSALKDFDWNSTVLKSAVPFPFAAFARSPSDWACEFSIGIVCTSTEANEAINTTFLIICNGLIWVKGCVAFAKNNKFMQPIKWQRTA